MNNAIVTGINIFAVRSCAGQALQQSSVTPNGLVFDRQWRLIASNGRFLTQRDTATMALIYPTVEDSHLRMTFVGMDSPPCTDNLQRERIRISDICEGIDQGGEIAAWFSTVLGIECRLLRVTTNSAKADFKRPDMSPVQVISEESLADLNSRLDEPVHMNRFRPNIVVSGLEPYEEDTWTRVAIGSIIYEASTEPCGRCSMVNIDQELGVQVGREPLKTLAAYRKFPGAILFGKYMVPVSSGMIRLNDRVENAPLVALTS